MGGEFLDGIAVGTAGILAGVGIVLAIWALPKSAILIGLALIAAALVANLIWRAVILFRKSRGEA